jgi:hypothetical protein
MLRYTPALCMNALLTDNPLGIRLTSEVHPNGLTVYRGETNDGVELTRTLALNESRNQIIAWANALGGPVKIAMGYDLDPDFASQQRIIPNRGPRAQEDTMRQHLLLGEIEPVFLATQERLLDSRSTLREILENEKRLDKKNCRLLGEYERAFLDERKGDFHRRCGLNGLLLYMAKMIKGSGAFHEEMRRITEEIPHAHHDWQAERGSLLLLPEDRILHRRDGNIGTQIAWHRNNMANGCLAFTMPKEGDVPRVVNMKPNRYAPQAPPPTFTLATRTTLPCSS